MWYIIDISAEKEGTPLEDLKVITASNIINLRTKAGMTQAELGELLSYSDKSISKWERAEAIPDAFVLKSMSEIFGVSVDYILSAHDKWQPEPEKAEPVGAFTLEISTDVKTELYYHCRWTSVKREFSREGLRKTRRGIAMLREEKEDDG